jgi:hypothetical protein
MFASFRRYSVEDLKEVVAYALARGVRVRKSEA